MRRSLFDASRVTFAKRGVPSRTCAESVEAVLWRNILSAFELSRLMCGEFTPREGRMWPSGLLFLLGNLRSLKFILFGWLFVESSFNDRIFCFHLPHPKPSNSNTRIEKKARWLKKKILKTNLLLSFYKVAEQIINLFNYYIMNHDFILEMLLFIHNLYRKLLVI